MDHNDAIDLAVFVVMPLIFIGTWVGCYFIHPGPVTLTLGVVPAYYLAKIAGWTVISMTPKR